MLSSPNPSITKSYDPWLTRPKTSTAPPGLRNLPPVQKVAKPVEPREPARKRAPRSNGLALCGTRSAWQRHQRHGEKCRECTDAYNERQKRNGYQGPPAACGTLSGYKRHYRLDEQPCSECRDVHNVYKRERRAKARSEREKAKA